MTPLERRTNKRAAAHAHTVERSVISAARSDQAPSTQKRSHAHGRRGVTKRTTATARRESLTGALLLGASEASGRVHLNPAFATFAQVGGNASEIRPPPRSHTRTYNTSFLSLKRTYGALNT